jgi:hypothetical protein
MDSEFYRDAFQKAMHELSALTAQRKALDDQRKELDARLVQVRKGALGLGSMCGQDPKTVETKYPELFPQQIEPEVGLTEAIRIVMKSHKGKTLTPIEIRTGLLNIGFDLGKYRNQLATIHITLKRLCDNGEIKMDIQKASGKTVYGSLESEKTRG